MHFRKISVLIGVTLLLWSPLTALAGSKTGIYLGAGVGRMDVKDTVNTDDDYSAYAAAYKIFTGYNFGKIPLLDLAIEGSYVFTDELSDEVNGIDVTYEQSSFNAFGLVGLSLGPVGIFGKLGGGAWTSDAKAGSQKKSDSGTDPIYGAGVSLTLFSITGRLEFEYFDQDNVDNLYMTSFSLMYTF
jgi:hypothetical protein